MFPFVRSALELLRARRLPPLEEPTDTHVSHHICLPWDIDIFMELNNGRTLTMLDMGRFALAQRIGLIDALRRNRWGLTMAGVSVRYRQRILAFERFEVWSRSVCFDDRFIYLEQGIWKRDGTCATHALYRSAVTGKSGLVRPKDVLKAMGREPVSPPMPDWIAAWVDADSQRPWPPMQDQDPNAITKVA